MNHDAGRKGARRFVALFLGCAALALAVGIACSSSNGGGGGGGGNNVDLSPTVRAGLLSSLGSLSASLTAAGSKQGALAAQAAALALEAGSQVTNVDSTFTAPLWAGPSGEAATGPAQALAFVVHVSNFPGNPSLQLNGSVVFQGTTQLQVAGAVGSAAPFPAAIGLLANSLTQVWLATAGQESSQSQSAGSGTCASQVLSFPGVVSCSQGGSANAGYSVTASSPAGIAGNTATGSATASLSTQALVSVELTYDCNSASPNLCSLISGGGGGGGGGYTPCSFPACALDLSGEVAMSGSCFANFGIFQDAGAGLPGVTYLSFSGGYQPPILLAMGGDVAIEGIPVLGPARLARSDAGAHLSVLQVFVDGGCPSCSRYYYANGEDAGTIALNVTSVVNRTVPDGGPSNLWCVGGEITADATGVDNAPGSLHVDMHLDAGT
jgi:hypothetical protein